WMQHISRVFGYALLATAIFILRPVVSGPLFLALWVALLLAVAVHISIIERPSWRFVSRYLALLLGIWSGFMLLGSAAVGNDPLRPLADFTMRNQQAAGSSEVRGCADMQQLQAVLKQADLDGKWVLLDFYADWCVSWKVMEKTVFANPEVQAALTDIRFLQA